MRMVYEKNTLQMLTSRLLPKRQQPLFMFFLLFRHSFTGSRATADRPSTINCFPSVHAYHR